MPQPWQNSKKRPTRIQPRPNVGQRQRRTPTLGRGWANSTPTLGKTLALCAVGHQRSADSGPKGGSDTRWTNVGTKRSQLYECLGWLTDLWRFYLHNYKIFMVYLVLQRSTRRYCWRLRFIMLFIVHKPTPGKIKMFEYGVHGPTRGIFQLKSYLVQPVLNILLPVIIIL